MKSPIIKSLGVLTLILVSFLVVNFVLATEAEDVARVRLVCESFSAGDPEAVAISNCDEILPDITLAEAINICQSELTSAANKKKCDINAVAPATADTPTDESKLITSKLDLFNGLGLMNGTPADITANAIKLVLGLVGTITLAMFIWGGILWMTSGGDAKKTKTAMDVFVWTVLGLLLIFGSYAILNFVISNL
jgi:hypothetical protein